APRADGGLTSRQVTTMASRRLEHENRWTSHCPMVSAEGRVFRRPGNWQALSCEYRDLAIKRVHRRCRWAFFVLVPVLSHQRGRRSTLRSRVLCIAECARFVGLKFPAARHF